jgi:hypothetical protein
LESNISGDDSHIRQKKWSIAQKTNKEIKKELSDLKSKFHQLHHPFLATCIGIKVMENGLLPRYDAIEGKSLKDQLVEKGQLSPPAIV